VQAPGACLSKMILTFIFINVRRRRMTWSTRAPFVLWLAFAHPLTACSSAGPASPNEPAPDAPPTYVEKPLTLELSLGTPDATAGGSETPVAAETLQITALDGATPVVTDLWLYTLGPDSELTPLTGFTSTAARKSPNLLMPATIGGAASGLAPADDGSANGLMTATTRGTWENGAFVSTVTGTVTVSFRAVVAAPIVVVAGVEDQRYAGAAAIDVDGSALEAPKSVGQPEKHVRRSFEREVSPILVNNCASCHRPGGPDDADFYLVTGTPDELVNDNFALKEQTEDCEADDAAGSQELADCIAKIDKAEFLVEPGAPGISDLLVRSRPDENAGTSPAGLVWYGGGNPKSRFNAKYGDRRMPSTTQSTDPSEWQDLPTYFDVTPADFQILFDWVAQGADQSAP